MFLISFTIFNHAIFFCINTCAMVLINQYSTGLFVSYYSVRRKILLQESSYRSYAQIIFPAGFASQGGPNKDAIMVRWS